MISKFLPVAALAGAALAASSCPLSVRISGTTDHVAHVAITNSGSEALTVFKGNTVLSEHATLDVVASAAGKDLEFEGVSVNYKRAGLDASMFQTIQPGETITTSVNAAKTYNLKGLEKVDITAVQGFRYVTGEVAPTLLSQTTLCDDVTSNTVTITPDQSKVESELISRGAPSTDSHISKRSIIYRSCTTAQQNSLQMTITNSISLASKAYTAAGTGAFYFTTWFMSTSQKRTVAAVYNRIRGVRSTSVTVSCVDLNGHCNGGGELSYAIASTRTIVTCPNNGYWGFSEFSPTCARFDYDRAGVLLHEISHLYGTHDWAFGPAHAKILSAAQAADNADSYEMYAASVRLGGCTG